MIQLQKFKWIAGVLLVTSAMANTGHAKNTKSKHEIEDFKVTGSFKFGKHYDFDFQADKKSRKNQYPMLDQLNFNQLYNVGLGIEKVLPLGEDTIKFVVQTKLSEKGITLKRAKIENEYFVAGLTDSNFCDSDAVPNTLSGNDTPNTVCKRVAQIGWKHQLDEGLSLAVTLENSFEGLREFVGKQEVTESTPGLVLADLVGEERAKELSKPLQSSNIVPTVGAHVKYEEAFGYLRLGGLFRADRFNEKGKKLVESGMWGVNVTSVVDLGTDQTALKIAGIYGKGLGEYLAGPSLLETKVPSVIFVQKNKKEEAMSLGTLGGSIGVEHCWLPKLRSTFAYGILRGTNDKEYKSDVYKQSHYASANLTYHPTENFMYGVEYAYDKLSASNKKDDKSKGRIQAAVGFKL